MYNELYDGLMKRLESFAFMLPRKDNMDIQAYYILAGEAFHLIRKLREIRLMDLPEEIELPYMEKRVKDLEEKFSKICEKE